MGKGLGKGLAALLADTQEDYDKFSYENLGDEGKEIKKIIVVKNRIVNIVAI